MKSRTLIIIITSCLCLCSCKNKYDLSMSDITFLNSEVDRMYQQDQDTRHVLASIDSLYGVDRKLHGRFLTFRDKREILQERFDEYKNKLDSVYQRLDEIDSINTNKLIALTKEYGFPSRERLKVHKAKAYFLFVHADKEYFDEIKTLIAQEYEAKRISEYEQAYILWHLNGRKTSMPSVGKDGNVIY